LRKITDEVIPTEVIPVKHDIVVLRQVVFLRDGQEDRPARRRLPRDLANVLNEIPEMQTPIESLDTGPEVIVLIRPSLQPDFQLHTPSVVQVGQHLVRSALA
jgi:hypothetical protein